MFCWNQLLLRNLCHILVERQPKKIKQNVTETDCWLFCYWGLSLYVFISDQDEIHRLRLFLYYCFVHGIMIKDAPKAIVCVSNKSRYLTKIHKRKEKLWNESFLLYWLSLHWCLFAALVCLQIRLLPTMMMTLQFMSHISRAST